MVNRVEFHLDDGSKFFTEDKINIQTIMGQIPIGWVEKYFGKITKTQILHNKYFSMLGKMCKDLNLGYSKGTIHNIIKPILFGYLKDQNHLFKNNIFEFSTKNLTSEGYSVLIDILKEVASDIFNYNFD